MFSGIHSYQYAPIVALLAVIAVAVFYNTFIAQPIGLTIYMNNTHITYTCSQCIVKRIIIEIGAYYRVTAKNDTLLENRLSLVENMDKGFRERGVNFTISNYGKARLAIDTRSTSGVIDLANYISSLFGFRKTIANQLATLSRVAEVYVQRGEQTYNIKVNGLVGNEVKIDKYPVIDSVAIVSSALVALVISWIAYGSRFAPGAGYMIAILTPPITCALLLVAPPPLALIGGTSVASFTTFLIASILKR